MARIPFILGHLPDPKFTKSGIERRLKQHFRRLKAQKAMLDLAEEAVEDVEIYGDKDAKEIPWSAKSKIIRRADLMHACVLKKSVFAQLKPEDRKRLDGVATGISIVGIPSGHRADEIAAALHADFPWLGPATEVVWHGLRRSVEHGDPGVRISPLLLDGPAGIGKSHLARKLAKLLGVPSMVVEATNENASFGVVGSQRSWGNSAPGRLINFILSEGVANPIVILDELEKAGDVRATKGQSYSLTEALLPMLEPLSAARWTCPYFEVPFDMRWVGWVMTTNNFRLLPDPLLSRCPPIRLSAPTIEQLKAFARRQGADRNLSELSVEAICEVLDRAGARGYLPDLRAVIRMLDRAEWLERRPRLQ
ncbi:MAG: AAA family ATPase [Rhodobacteraceae bacterium]|nr:AAA family ATPase [Paracoccaceae bacterium]MCF8515209.1 AAA family ATPase [Paracoccaceae bacterium]MCF8519607.1 AAA family ATPase [Paracoccaceae bacterium]